MAEMPIVWDRSLDEATAVSDGDATTVMAKAGSELREVKAASNQWDLEAMHREIEALLKDKLFK